MIPWRRYPALGIIVAAFLCLALLYSWATPILESGDEVSHYPFVKHLAEGGGLPIQRRGDKTPWHQEGSQPPLYYALTGLATGWIDTTDYDAVVKLNPHANVAVPLATDNQNLVVHSPALESFPWRGTTLAIYLARLISVLMAAVGVTFTYLSGRLLFPSRPNLAIAAAGLHAFNPMFLFTSASVSNDNLAIMLCSIAFYLTLRLLRPESTGSWRELLRLGVVIGLGAIAKVSALAFLPLLGVVLLRLLWRRREWALAWRAAIAVGGPVALIAGWWYARNWQLYGDPTGMQMMAAIAGARPPGTTLWDLGIGAQWQGFRETFWGVFGGYTVVPPRWFYSAGDILWMLAGVGLLVWLYFRLRSRQGPGWPVGLMLIWIAVTFLGVVRWTLMTYGSLGRLMFPALSAISILTALGLLELWSVLARGAWRRQTRSRLAIAWSGLAGPLVAFGMAGVAAFVAVWYIHPAYVPSPPVSGAAAVPETATDIVFGERLALLGFDLAQSEVTPGDSLRVNLYWRVLGAMDRDYSIYMHLVDGDPAAKIGAYDSYPGGGLTSTSLLVPGTVIKDAFSLPVQRITENGTEAQLLVGLYDAKTGERLPRTDSSGQGIGEQPLASVRVVVPETLPADVTPLSASFADTVDLLGYRFAPDTVRPGAPVNVVLYWKARRPLAKDYTLFAQLIDQDGVQVSQNDHQPQQGRLPTSKWQPGEVVVDAFAIPPAADAGSGPYQLRIGWYDLATGERIGRTSGPPPLPDTQILLSGLKAAN